MRRLSETRERSIPEVELWRLEGRNREPGQELPPSRGLSEPFLAVPLLACASERA